MPNFDSSRFGSGLYSGGNFDNERFSNSFNSATKGQLETGRSRLTPDQHDALARALSGTSRGTAYNEAVSLAQALGLNVPGRVTPGMTVTDTVLAGLDPLAEVAQVDTQLDPISMTVDNIPDVTQSVLTSYSPTTATNTRANFGSILGGVENPGTAFSGGATGLSPSDLNAPDGLPSRTGVFGPKAGLLAGGILGSALAGPIGGLLGAMAGGAIGGASRTGPAGGSGGLLGGMFGGSSSGDGNQGPGPGGRGPGGTGGGSRGSQGPGSGSGSRGGGNKGEQGSRR